MSKMTFNQNQFRTRVGQMAIASFKEASDFAQSFLTEEVREFPRETVRKQGVGKTGKFAGSPRDVVDTGALRDSYTATEGYAGSEIRLDVIWDAPHAELVYSGTGQIPPYPWVQLSQREFDWEESLKRNWENG